MPVKFIGRHNLKSDTYVWYDNRADSCVNYQDYRATR
jgi:hypothetical protein